jgi:hypothetical protein
MASIKPPRPTSLRPPRQNYEGPKTGSGQHPAVQAFRAKLQSIHEHTVPAMSEIDEDLAQYLVEDDDTEEPTPTTPPPKGPKP